MSINIKQFIVRSAAAGLLLASVQASGGAVVGVGIDLAAVPVAAPVRAAPALVVSEGGWGPWTPVAPAPVVVLAPAPVVVLAPAVIYRAPAVAVYYGVPGYVGGVYWHGHGGRPPYGPPAHGGQPPAHGAGQPGGAGQAH